MCICLLSKRLNHEKKLKSGFKIQLFKCRKQTVDITATNAELLSCKKNKNKTLIEIVKNKNLNIAYNSKYLKLKNCTQ